MKKKKILGIAIGAAAVLGLGALKLLSNNDDEPDSDDLYAPPLDDKDCDESLSVWDAADIWLSQGMDEDYMFGYSEDELRDALS